MRRWAREAEQLSRASSIRRSALVFARPLRIRSGPTSGSSPPRLTYFPAATSFARGTPDLRRARGEGGGDASHPAEPRPRLPEAQRVDKAITSLEASRAPRPDQGRAVSYLGLAYARAGRYAEAYRSFLLRGQNRARVRDRDQPERRASATSIHQQLGRTPHGPLPPRKQRHRQRPRSVARRPRKRSRLPASAPASTPLLPRSPPRPEPVARRLSASGIISLTPEAPRISEDSMMFVLPRRTRYRRSNLRFGCLDGVERGGRGYAGRPEQRLRAQDVGGRGAQAADRAPRPTSCCAPMKRRRSRSRSARAAGADHPRRGSRADAARWRAHQGGDLSTRSRMRRSRGKRDQGEVRLRRHAAGTW